MNRRGFLQLLGAAGVLAVSAADWFVPRAFAAPALENVPEKFGELQSAIERLFPAGVIELPRYDNDAAMSGFGAAPARAIKRETAHFRKYDHLSCKLGYCKTISHAGDARIERIMVASFFTAFLQVSRRPENRNAKLLWRRTPKRIDRDDRIIIESRGVLEQTGWRARLGVEPRQEMGAL